MDPWKQDGFPWKLDGFSWKQDGFPWKQDEFPWKLVRIFIKTSWIHGNKMDFHGN